VCMCVCVCMCMCVWEGLKHSSLMKVAVCGVWVAGWERDGDRAEGTQRRDREGASRGRDIERQGHSRRRCLHILHGTLAHSAAPHCRCSLSSHPTPRLPLGPGMNSPLLPSSVSHRAWFQSEVSQPSQSLKKRRSRRISASARARSGVPAPGPAAAADEEDEEQGGRPVVAVGRCCCYGEKRHPKHRRNVSKPHAGSCGTQLPGPTSGQRQAPPKRPTFAWSLLELE
jgi:hypothetical protein